MKKTPLLLLLTLMAFFTFADESTVDLKAFGQLYFERMSATQAPNATKADIEAYLELLAEDVGHTHLPWVTDGSRAPNAKDGHREGMTFYLGAHSEFTSELLDIYTFNQSAVAIRYTKSAKGIHPQSKQPIEYQHVMMEVLEMDNGKVGVIRKYHQ
ncbi:nuclear transport factor 2 family protein [Thalassotalea ganghwensis]